ncbi:TIGR04086 family membrane protein [Clostridium estertheticum]|uniref:TIGR04086 family membrane protein n=1 Tax=Clostridium estertheticum TaxID=238834 RepID=UPI001C0D9D21|nr:TIGR04086 family membrane protein [Clostridium estertheticum]MBU3216169.1 TIGR04086 family membrane protein [Clostridium estertheticum]MCB2306096.1 TIGR04086 family membrane protein [Clostridium estertheticum]MCB2344269.1 TIGR04086 family membrane protein [Clostridium estertheticum]MCB2349189.1 TIGR04086 family membrane protein [Clostridium estertheticum]WAG44939.1 TIGR04086 family membrane protein [Clostridium estertheticum]
MENKKKYSYAGEGVFRASILTLIILVIYSIVTTVLPASMKVTSVFYIVITLVSVLYGSIFAAKKAGEKGWLMGIMVAATYMLILYLVKVFGGGSAAIGTREIVRTSLALGIGTLSGMLGINL